MTLVVHAFGRTNIGRVRDHNEDSFYSGRTVFAVADGMGGHAAGEVASAAALGPLSELDGASFDEPDQATDALSSAVTEANVLVLDRAAADPELRGMGTTLTTVMIRGQRLHMAHVGDSRAYLLRGNAFELLTEDHTLVNQLVKEGRLTEEQAAVHPQRSVITRAIGVERNLAVDTMHEPLVLMPGDQILLCSDGLTGPVSEAEIAQILAEEPDGDVACQRLIDAANAGGGPDNITTVLLRVEGDAPVVADAPVPKAGLRDDDATAELGDPETLEELATITPSSGLDAQRLRELNDGSADIDDTPPELRGSTARRRGAMAVGVVLIAGVLLLGGFLLLQRQFFVGVTGDEEIGIYRGIQGEVLGISLATLLETQALTLDDLPTTLHEELRAGISFPTRAEAEQYVQTTLQDQALGLDVETERPDPEGQPATADPIEPTATPTPTPTASVKAEPTVTATE